jgi:hypothetical protein
MPWRRGSFREADRRCIAGSRKGRTRIGVGSRSPCACPTIDPCCPSVTSRDAASITATRPARPSAASARFGSKSLSALTITPSRVEMVSEMTGWLTNNSSAITSSVILFLKYIRVAFRPCANVKPRGRPTPLSQVTSSLTRRRSSRIEPGSSR